MITNQVADPEIDAMGKVVSALDPLSPETRKRIWEWVADRYGLHGQPESIPLATAASGRPSQSTDNKPEGTINTVSIRLGAESCRDLLIASAAYLMVFQGKDRFTRSELLATAKEAQAWKSDHGSQVSINLRRMQDAQELFEKAKDVFALSPKKLKELEAKIVE